ncbi:unnamed protein product [Knipowitschia caucasica]
MDPGRLLFLMLRLYGPWLCYGQVSVIVPCEMSQATAQCSFKNLKEVPVLPNYTENLYLDFNNISELHSASLRGLRLLERVDLGAQRRPLVIRNNAFLCQKQLKTLILDSNLDLMLEPRAFAGLYSLQELDLTNCNLNDSILSGNYLQPLQSLKTLRLSSNNIVRLRPAKMFFQIRNLKNVDLKNNQIDRLCEDDLFGFQGKNFTHFNLDSNKLYKTMLTPDFDWEQCGNPFRNMAFDTLDLSRVGFDTASFRLFLKAIAGTLIKSLHHSGKLGRNFSFNNLLDPDKKTFEGLQSSSLEAFDLSNNFIFSLQPSVFSPLTDAKIINICHNKINQINQGAFRGLENSLQLLNLSHNLIGEIYSETFQHLTSLKILDLSFNHIGALGHQSFSGLSSLKLLNLNSNSLRKLTSTVYLPKLRFLYLNNNRLESLYNINNLAGRNITLLEVEGNQLTLLNDVFAIVEYFPNLETLIFGGNFIKWCHSPRTSTNNSLLVLDLHDSSLQIIWSQGFCLDIFDHFGNLLGLNLSHNSIQSLPQGLFSSLRSIREIYLSSNSLTYLMSHIFPSSLQILDLSNNFLASPNPDTFRSLAYINLAGNHFYCDCNLEGFLEWLNSTNITFLTPKEDLRCTFPSSLQNLPLLSYANVKPCV